MSSRRKHDILMAEQKREEGEKQEQVAMRLAKQKQKTAMRKKNLKYKWTRWHFSKWRKTTASVLRQLK